MSPANTATGSEPEDDAERSQSLQEMTSWEGVARDPGGMRATYSGDGAAHVCAVA
jgi:hypothetical protein